MLEKWLQEIEDANNLQALDEVRVKLLGKNGLITQQLKNLGSLSIEDKKTLGLAINQQKDKCLNALVERKKILEEQAINEKLMANAVDITLPITDEVWGSIHPVAKAILDINNYFSQFGFTVKTGPEIDSEYYNFDALNIPTHHPARQNHDTFFLKGMAGLLRTHTSTVQIRTMQKQKPPLRIIAPGRVYRSDSDATHTPMFHQIEVLVVEKNLNMGHLKTTLIDFCRWFFAQEDLPVRFRPSFFPFTEPSAEVDISCQKNKDSLKIGHGGNSWLEIMGCGMVHPQVLVNCNIDPQEFSGFAFGMGVERLVMLKSGISDIRSLYEGDSRWLKHYGSNGVVA